MGLGAPRRKTDRTRHCSGWSCGPQPGPGRTPPSQNLPAVRANRLNTNGSRGSRPAKCCSGACQTAAHRALHLGNMHRRPQLVDEVTPLRRTDQLNERPGRLGVVGLIVATAPGRGARGAVVDGGRRLDPLCTACSYSARTWAGGAPFGGARAGSQTRAGTGGSADYRLERLVATGPEHSVLRGGGLSCRRARTRRGRSVGRFVGWANRAVNQPTAHAQS